ncbi:MAG TPA: aminoglycoside phosphotransferase family protein [Rhizomicrobium sp.]|jgi:aminoglycoside phosphotransferase (APT) family kinase protein
MFEHLSRRNPSPILAVPSAPDQMQENRPETYGEIAAALVAMRLIVSGESFDAAALSGGVSCDVWRIDTVRRGAFVLKRALPKLRVAADWHAPAARAHTEVEWLKLVAQIDPALVPKVIGEDTGRHMFAMEYLRPETYPVWKAQLAAGYPDRAFAAQVGAALARIHAATAGRQAIADRFATQPQFHALRLEPYLLYTAQQHPDVAARIRALADSVATARIALMQGDISPKNILCGPHGAVFLDAETAAYGDPAFDLAFCLNHLLLKCIWHPEFSDSYLQCFSALSDGYLMGVTWEQPPQIEQRSAALLPALLLARIDGKSPVEYIRDPRDQNFVRGFAKRHLTSAAGPLDDIAKEWHAKLRGL